MPRLRVSNRKEQPKEDELVIDVRKGFYDEEYNQHARAEATPFVEKALQALSSGQNVLVTCQSGLARSQFVALLVSASLPSTSSFEIEMNLEFLHEHRKPWLDSDFQCEKRLKKQKS